MPVLAWYLITGAAAAVGAGYFVNKAGTAVEETTNSTVKVIVVAAIALLAAKHYKVI